MLASLFILSFTLVPVLLLVGVAVQWVRAPADTPTVELKPPRPAARPTSAQRVERRMTRTQAWRFHADKMVSLGNITAGIAHEIKNPLNFVVNFADVAADLVDELEVELGGGDLGETAADLLEDLRESTRRIREHGQRADAIIQGMLQHMDGQGGVIERVPLHDLLDEHLSLTYRSLKNRMPGFAVVLRRDYDPAITLVDVAARDLRRAVGNLLDNAFYAVLERQRTAGPGYTPTVTVATHLTGRTVEIVVEDNGPGLSEAVQARLFEPFFTTKPTGVGAGLGLSVSYAIVVQGHGGRLRAEPVETGGARFIITLPRAA